MVYVYVLQLSEGKWYVGLTHRSVKARFKEHMEGKGSAWTKKYKPIKIHKIISKKQYSIIDYNTENRFTREYMEEYGIENVRGGIYTSLTLQEELQRYLELTIESQERWYNGKFMGDDEECDFIKKMDKLISELEAGNLCFNCHMKGHYSNNCPYPKW